MDRYVPIRDLFAREILDAGGRPAVEVEMLADKEVTGKASVSLTDPQRRRSRTGDAAAGQSGANRESAVVSSVVENINSDIAQELIGTNIFDQAEIDRTLRRLDGVPDKHILNRAATLAVSAAAARTAAAALNVPLYRYLGGTQAIRMPVPVVDVINGGRNEEDMPDFRGFMIVPSIEGTFQEQLNICVEVWHAVVQELRRRGMELGPEQKTGLRAGLRDAVEALCLIRSAAERAGHHPGTDIMTALDAGASEMYDVSGKAYLFRAEGKKRGGEVLRTTEAMAGCYRELTSGFAICAIEDPLVPGDREGWQKLSHSLPGGVRLVRKAVPETDTLRPGQVQKDEKMCAGAVRIDVSLAGTLTETFELIRKAREAGELIEISDTANRTADTLASDVAVAAGAGYIRAGALRGIEHVERYNRLLRIEEQFPFYPRQIR